jgi:hypothetical protein
MYYKDRDFPELKAERYNKPNEILAVIESPEGMQRVIDELNGLLIKLNTAEEALVWANRYAAQINSGVMGVNLRDITGQALQDIRKK